MALFPADSEWKLGWRIVAAAAVANATGISLLFYSFSMFLRPMNADFGLTPAQGGVVQSLIVMAALGAPVIGRLVDRTGFHMMFLACTMAMAGVEVGLALGGNGFWAMALGTALIGFIGGGSSSVLLTRPVSAHFHRYRGLALGCVGVGISITTMFVPLWLESVIAHHGWRQGYLALAGIAVLTGLPLALLLMPRNVRVRGGASAPTDTDRSHFRTRDFWLITAANFCASMATSGAISQMSPMLQESGLSAKTAAVGLSTFAFGQFVGKLGGGLLLDLLRPQLVAAVLTLVPTLSFVLFLTAGPIAAPLLLATGLLGLLQGADVSIFSFFIARRFPIERYGTIFGAMHGIGWIGTAAGATGFGVSFGLAHGYWLAQSVSIGLLVLSAALILTIRLPAKD